MKQILLMIAVVALVGCGTTSRVDDPSKTNTTQKHTASVDADKLIFEEEGAIRLRNTKQPFTGKVTVHYDNGERAAEFMALRGLVHGKYLIFNTNGKLLAEIFLRGAVPLFSKTLPPISEARFFHESGETLFILKKRRGATWGDMVFWDESGRIRIMTNMDSATSGYVILWHESGGKHVEGSIGDWQKIAEVKGKSWDEKGNETNENIMQTVQKVFREDVGPNLKKMMEVVYRVGAMVDSLKK